MASFTLGLDLGFAADSTALAILERPARKEQPYQVRHLQRFLLGTPYTEIVPDVATLMRTPQLRGSFLVVDQTGVGRPVVELLQRADIPGAVVPVTITAGMATTRQEDGSYHVAKKELVSVLQILLQSRRLKVARSLADAEVLVREMQNFRVKITASANETYEAWREGQHDDLVLAVALACWYAEQHSTLSAQSFGVPPPAQRSAFATAPKGVF